MIHVLSIFFNVSLVRDVWWSTSRKSMWLSKFKFWQIKYGFIFTKPSQYQPQWPALSFGAKIIQIGPLRASQSRRGCKMEKKYQFYSIKRNFTKMLAQRAFFKILIWNFQRVFYRHSFNVSEIYWSIRQLFFKIFAFKGLISVVSVNILTFKCLKIIFLFHKTLKKYIHRLRNVKSYVLPFEIVQIRRVYAVLSPFFWHHPKLTLPECTVSRGFLTCFS